MAARMMCAAVLTGLLSSAAGAQTTLPSAPVQMGLPPAPPPVRSAPLSGDLPGPSVSMPRPDVFRAGPQTYAPQFDQLPAFDPRFFPFPCCGSFVGPVLVPVKPRPQRSSVRSGPQAGYLRLLAEPDTAEVYIDGFYTGTVLDVRRLLTLEPGPHRIELRAAGHESATFDIRIVPNETITYRTDLQRSAPAGPPPAATAPVPKTFYVIPNCYAGDRPPERAALPRTCDVARLRTIPPVLNTIQRPRAAP